MPNLIDPKVAPFQPRLERFCEQLELAVTESQITQMLVYLSLFIKWNKAYNLSAIRDPEAMLVKHLFDSLVIATEFNRHPDKKRIIDVGTGGGLPGIPMAILFPERNFTLLDSAGKKIRFLYQVRQTLALANVTLENGRVEKYQPKPCFDVVMSRAFASLKDMTDWCQHLLQPTGQFWAMKGLYPEDEIAQMAPQFEVHDSRNLQIKGLDGERCLVVIQIKN